MSRYLILFLFFFSMGSAFAQSSRWIDVEWEPVPEVKEYEVELFQEGPNNQKLPRGKFKIDQSAWSHAVSPGKYSMRIRSLDDRGVPGEWSDFIPVKVRLPNPQPLRPVPGVKLTDTEINFEWSEVEGASRYQLVVKDTKNSIIHNSLTTEKKQSVFVEPLGTYRWGVFALENKEPPKGEGEWTAASLRSFQRVGTLLDAPYIAVGVSRKINIKWDRVRAAQSYEIEYLPPQDSRGTAKKFRVPKFGFTFDRKLLQEGTTTIAIRSVAPGYQDSKPSLVKIDRSGDKIELEDIVQGRDKPRPATAPTLAYYRHQLFLSLAAARYTYESEDFDKDTRLDQKKLTGVGINLEWLFQPRLNSWIHKVDLSALNLSSGLESGLNSHAAYTLNWWKRSGDHKFLLGGGASYLSLPAFMGDRLENKVSQETSSSVGPELNASYLLALDEFWSVHAHMNLAYHMSYLSSPRDNGDHYTWLRGQLRFLRYISETQAIFVGTDYQKWEQRWKEDLSALSGVSLTLGYKVGF